MEQEKVGIIGAGVAGLARAVLESESGAQVTLFEKTALAGGRAGSFFDPATHTSLDYCAHVWMNSCSAFRQFAQKLQLLSSWRENSSLYFELPRDEAAPDSRLNGSSASRLAFHELGESGWLPGLLRFVPSFVSWKSLSLTEKAILAAQLVRMKRLRSFQGTIGDWLKDQKTPETLIRQFWNPVIVSALSCSLDEASLYYARKVCYESFLARRNGNHFWTAEQPLGEIFGEDLRNRLKRQGIGILTKTTVVRLLTERNVCVGCELSDGQKRFFDRTILAADLTSARKLLKPLAEQTGAYVPRAISTVHVWTDRPIIEEPYALFPGRLIQWIIQSRPAPENGERGWYSQIIVSGSDEWLDRRRDFDRQIRWEIEQLQPTVQIRRLLPIHFQKATFVPSDAFERERKKLTSPYERLVIIGDWTDTDWPATMESAVRSARRGFPGADDSLRPGTISADGSF